MNLAQVETFLVLAEELHFGHTAARLYTSQPRVSRLVASLECEVGGVLVERTSRQVRLTPLGAQFRDGLQPVYAQLQAAFGQARAAARQTGGTLRVGFTETTMDPALPRLVHRFETVHPECQVTLQEVEIFDPYAALRRDEIDIEVTWLAVEETDLTTGPAITCKQRVLAVSPTHQLAGRKSVSVEELADYAVAWVPPPFPRALYEALIPAVTPAGRTIPRGETAHSFNEILYQVARGRVVHPTAAVSELHLTDIALIPISDLPPMPLGLIWCTARENARIRAFAALAAEPARAPATPWANTGPLATTPRR